MPQADERHPATRRTPSRIAGHGLRAAAPIDRGTVVVRFAAAPSTVDDLHDLNHSCDPNLSWLDDHTLIAGRGIAAEEELTVDYATWLADPDFVLYCHCETYRCRQVIEGHDWRIPQLQTRYAGWFTPELQRRVDATPG
ncbi:MAG TPA: SET domain-containing protein [Jatrophihabitans sp.]|nr:SET domain-containing protein [Jatrophihabitans sp.]